MNKRRRSPPLWFEAPVEASDYWQLKDPADDEWKKRKVLMMIERIRMVLRDN